MPREGQWVHTNLAGLANGERDSAEGAEPQRKKEKGTTDGAPERNEKGQQRPGAVAEGTSPQILYDSFKSAELILYERERGLIMSAESLGRAG